MEARDGDAMFDEQLTAAGAAIELCANMSAYANYLVFQALHAAEEAGIPDDDHRVRGLKALRDIWDEKLTEGFGLATQRDPTGPRGAAAVTRPWRDPEFAPV